MVVSARLTQEIDQRHLLQLAVRGIRTWVQSRAARPIEVVTPSVRPLLRALASSRVESPSPLLNEARMRWEAMEVVNWIISNS